MNKQQYKRAYHLYRLIQLLEEQLNPTSDNAYEYLWHQIKILTIELSALNGWCVMEHYNDSQRHDPYDDYWWLWHRFPLHVASNVERAFKRESELDPYQREYVRNYLTNGAPVELWT